MKDQKKAKVIGRCFYCSGSVKSTDKHTALIQKPRGQEVMALAHADWTGCQKATNQDSYWFIIEREIAKTTESLSG